MNDNNCTMIHNRITYKCSISLALGIIGGKWKPLILWHLKDKVLRFGELKRTLDSITQKMLTQQLRELESDGLVNRHIYTQIPPKVEYSLTEKGNTVVPILDMISKWGAGYCTENKHLPNSSIEQS
jgi:DNA-binding HxlR family transcriptional regulator